MQIILLLILLSDDNKFKYFDRSYFLYAVYIKKKTKKLKPL